MLALFMLPFINLKFCICAGVCVGAYVQVCVWMHMCKCVCMHTCLYVHIEQPIAVKQCLLVFSMFVCSYAGVIPRDQSIAWCAVCLHLSLDALLRDCAVRYRDYCVSGATLSVDINRVALVR